MSEIHILNVGEGDCIIFKSNSGHVTVFDICGGNISPKKQLEQQVCKASLFNDTKGNYNMSSYPTNPINFLKQKMKVDSIFRFILSHPDMDHLDGIDNLMRNFTVSNFWDSGVRKEKPDFSNYGKYEEKDWDRYASIIARSDTTLTVVSPKAGAKNKYFNKDEKEEEGGDYIYIYAPNSSLIESANDSNSAESINDASYVIVYRSAGGRILLSGDAHDKSWELILGKGSIDLKGCELMVAPHHGRDSNRSWEFLDKITPQFSVLGCASSEHLAYNAWNYRKLKKVTQNQTGNIAVYPQKEGLCIYAENKKFVESYEGSNTEKTDNYGNYYLTFIPKHETY